MHGLRSPSCRLPIPAPGRGASCMMDTSIRRRTTVKVKYLEVDLKETFNGLSAILVFARLEIPPHRGSEITHSQWNECAEGLGFESDAINALVEIAAVLVPKAPKSDMKVNWDEVRALHLYTLS